MIQLLITADDFCMSPLYNREIIKLAKERSISSISVMTKHNWKQQLDDISNLQYTCQWKNISIWLHLEFLEKENNYNSTIQKQREQFQLAFGRQPDHLDIHKDTPDHEFDNLCTQQVITLANKNNIPCRNRANTIMTKKHTDWTMYIISRKSKENIDARFAGLEDNKSYELVTHPGIFDPAITSSLNKERANDITMIQYINTIVRNRSIQLISSKNITL